MENIENITIQANVIFKHGGTYYWDNDNGKGVNYIPAEGEMIIYDALSQKDEGYTSDDRPYVRVKYGNGKNFAKDLPFSGSQVNWAQNVNTAADYVQNRTHYYNDDGTIGKKLPDGFISDIIARKDYVDGVAGQALADAQKYADQKETNAVAAAKKYVDDEDKFVIDKNTIKELGGIAANTNLNGMTTHKILEKLLYPYVDASVGNAIASPSNGGTYEKGTIKTITSVSITVTKKSEPITSVALYDGSKLIEKKTNVANGGIITFSGLNKTVSSNGGKLTVEVIYPDEKGIAKTVTKETGAFTFILPYYYGVCGAADTINGDLVRRLEKDLKAKGTKTYSYKTNTQRMVIAYPSSYGKLRLIKDGNGINNTNAFGDPITVGVTNDFGVTEEYYVYTNGVTSCDATMTFSY